ncbi:glycosyltransferase [Cochlodiniinecator piscidefendens]|uniref:glycosyltransferase n=1 Tax=Cochlodiniinecator piscidefendens TaxID=2715756 RepID=UPI00140CD8A1|nr:glycosyltransferase family 2 protein [Cochlodiniinecator piscidefendens]
MKRPISLLTVILNYKTPDMTLQSIVAATTEMQGISGNIVVVDNDSGDGSFEKLQAETQDMEHVHVVASGHNGGFGAGNNFGIQWALSAGLKPDYVYILNSDAFPGKNSIQALLDALENHKNIGFAGSYIHGPDAQGHVTTFRFPSIASELEGAARFGPISRALKSAVVPIPIPEVTQPVDWLAGASMMMRFQTLEEIGLFDERFFLYFEETDLCLRAQRAGWQVLFVRESEVMHIGSVSTGMKSWQRTPKFWFDSRHHYFCKNHGKFYALGATLAHVSGGLLWRIRRLIQRKPQADPNHFLRDLIRHSFWRKRAVADVPQISTKTQEA